ncbi:hypothetical protein A0H81_11096 [Grifola frondosa]|uniref:Uncharacterized protein n=1 Tax=Grifola frondosa TaxID=5627 RepID=A0A1C7LVP2_GRIFR|nr:hypothetical protein A0H81_11096 [Grifola frondosa]
MHTVGLDDPKSPGEVGEMPAFEEAGKKSRFESLQFSALSLLSIIYDYVIILCGRDHRSFLIAKMSNAARDPSYTESDFSEKWQLYSGGLAHIWMTDSFRCFCIIFSMVIFLCFAPAAYTLAKLFAIISTFCGLYGILVGNVYAFLLRRVPNGRVWVKNVDETESSGCFNAQNLITIPLASCHWSVLFYFPAAAFAGSVWLEEVAQVSASPTPYQRENSLTIASSEV